jgi:branched-chain amino acid transport system permease protein
MRSLTGAVVGAFAVTGVRQALLALERGVDVGGVGISLPGGAQEITLAIILLLILTFRPQGLVGDNEMTLSGGARDSGK